MAIVIPTLVRPHLPETVRRCRLAIRDVHDAHIEVWVNNRTGLSKVQMRLLREASGPRTEVRFHEQWHPTAESSAMFAASSANADWIWIMGDDDAPLPDSGAVARELCNQHADLWLLNFCVKGTQKNDHPRRYYSLRTDTAVVSGATAFDNLGFVSALSTLSCLLIRTSVMDMDLFSRLHGLSGIYSHTFALRCWLDHGLVGLLGEPLLQRTERTSDEIGDDIRKAHRKGEHPSFPWTVGLWRLATATADILSRSPIELLKARELELSVQPDRLIVVVSTTRRVLLRAYDELIKSDDPSGQKVALEEIASHPDFSATARAAMNDPELALESPISLDPANWSVCWYEVKGNLGQCPETT
jgi:hypothetical protein